MMSDEEKATKRGWGIDYALRLHPANKKASAEQVIKDAKKFEKWILNIPDAKVLRLAKGEKK